MARVENFLKVNKWGDVYQRPESTCLSTERVMLRKLGKSLMMSQPYNCIIENVCAIWYHLHNLKNMKNTHAGELLKVTLFHGVFHVFQNVQMVPNRVKHYNVSLQQFQPLFMQATSLARKKIVHHTSFESRKRANAACLVACYSVSVAIDARTFFFFFFWSECAVFLFVIEEVFT